jgi:hypothetical protein
MVIGFVLAELFSWAYPAETVFRRRVISITFATVSYGQRLSGRGRLSARLRGVRRRPSGDRQRLSVVARLRYLQGDLRYIERLDLPAADRDKILHHNVQALFGFAR